MVVHPDVQYPEHRDKRNPNQAHSTFLKNGTLPLGQFPERAAFLKMANYDLDNFQSEQHSSGMANYDLDHFNSEQLSFQVLAIHICGY
jgi:hypothetical protein